MTTHLLSQRRTVRVEQREVEIHPLDLTRNALDRRARPKTPSKSSSRPTTAASEDFEEQFEPLVDPEGN